MDLGDLREDQILDERSFSMLCFDIMALFHWTYDELMELPLPAFFALMEYLPKR